MPSMLWIFVFAMALTLLITTITRSVWTWGEGDKISEDYDTFNKVTCVAAPTVAAAITGVSLYKAFY